MRHTMVRGEDNVVSGFDTCVWVKAEGVALDYLFCEGLGSGWRCGGSGLEGRED